jgi:ankyrin repeat protein
VLLDAGANPNVQNKLGGTPLMWAASYGQDAAVRMLLARGADPRIKDVDGVTAAGWAAKNGRVSLEMILRQAEKQKPEGGRQ